MPTSLRLRVEQERLIGQLLVRLIDDHKMTFEEIISDDPFNEKFGYQTEDGLRGALMRSYAAARVGSAYHIAGEDKRRAIHDYLMDMADDTPNYSEEENRVSEEAMMLVNYCLFLGYQAVMSGKVHRGSGHEVPRGHGFWIKVKGKTVDAYLAEVARAVETWVWLVERS
jgi:hypothetical protein